MKVLEVDKDTFNVNVHLPLALLSQEQSDIALTKFSHSKHQLHRLVTVINLNLISLSINFELTVVFHIPSNTLVNILQFYSVKTY